MVINTPYTCVACQSGIQPVLDLGMQPLANSYLSAPDAVEQLYPLAVGFCHQCKLLQLSHIISPVHLFKEYSYFSSISTSFMSHAEEMADTLIRKLRLKQFTSTVMEIGSNDGYLLQHFKGYSQLVGIEPATNIANVAISKDIPTINIFFDEHAVEPIMDYFGDQLDLIVGNNVLAHMPNINGVFQSVKQLLKPYGVAVFEVPYVYELVHNLEFDTIYHEHVFYFSITALEQITNKFGLHIIDVEDQNVHGGSIRVYIGHDDYDPFSTASQKDNYLWFENLVGINRVETYLEFSANVPAIKSSLRLLLSDLKGVSVAAYGAAAKGTVLLNYCQLDSDYIDFIVDRSQHKQGKYMPGMHQPIYHPSALLDENPDYVLLLSWNWKDEIIAQQIEYIENGGHFIVPIPVPQVLNP